MPKQIVGNVHWIEKSQQTIKVVDAEAAFSDPDQAKAQVLFAEASGDRKQIRLARLAYRQFQGMRYRGENRAKVAKTGGSKSKRLTPAKSVGRNKAKKVLKRK